MDMQKSSSGFTLIELMITVAIIGVLASFAIPAYQRYVARAQTSEAIIMLEGARSVVDEYVSQAGIIPNSLAELDVLGVKTSGKFVTTIEGSQLSGAAGELIATFRSGNMNRDLRGHTVHFERDANGLWTCGTGGSNPVDTVYLPAACR
jgi:type IV pilus assembly protein PilA